MQRLYPEPRSPVDVVQAYTDPSRASHDGRPWVYVCMVASADGGTAVEGRSGALGGAGDRSVFTALRGQADMVLVGAGTARAEHYGPPKRPDLRIAVVTRSLDVDWESALMRSGQAVIVTTEDAGDVPSYVPVIRGGTRRRRSRHGTAAHARRRCAHGDGRGRTDPERSADRGEVSSMSSASPSPPRSSPATQRASCTAMRRLSRAWRSCTCSRRTARCSCATALRRRDRGRTASARWSSRAA